MRDVESWDWRVDRIAWIDVETDGLVRQGKPFPRVLEVALILTDGALCELSRYSAVVRYPGHVLDAMEPHPVVVEMHERSGLWEALRSPCAVCLEDAEVGMIDALDAHPGDGPIVWGGFSPAAIDRPILGFYMPTFYERIHHRSIDVSSSKLTLLNWGGLATEKNETEHRALSDVLASIEVARQHRRFLQQKRIPDPTGIAC